MKFDYCRQQTFWELVVSMVNKGHTANVAIDMIYAVYGRRTAVTHILQKIKASQRESGNPALAE